jgi:hypothetical protein
MLTTRQVRDILKQHVQQNVFNPFWTNKTRKNPGDVRSVKVYLEGNTSRVIHALVKAGVDLNDINVTPGSEYRGVGGLTVRCILA